MSEQRGRVGRPSTLRDGRTVSVTLGATEVEFLESVCPVGTSRSSYVRQLLRTEMDPTRERVALKECAAALAEILAWMETAHSEDAMKPGAWPMIDRARTAIKLAEYQRVG